MDSETSEKQKPLVPENQEFKHVQQKKERAAQTEPDDDDQKQTKSALRELKARIEELETEFLIRNLDYKKLREEFNNFKMLTLKSKRVQTSKNTQISFSDKSNFLSNLENFDEVSESIYDYYEDKNILFTCDDSDYDLVKYDDIVEKEFINKGVSTSSDQQTINNNKCDSLQNPITNSKYKTSSLNPYAASFFPGKDKILFSNPEETTQEVQRDNDDQKDSDLLLDIPFHTSNNIPYFTFLFCNNFWRNHENIVEKIHALVQQIIYQFKLLNRKVNVVSFRYLYFFEVDDLMSYEKSKEFNSLRKIHKKVIRNMVNALLKDELDTNVTFVRSIDEYKSRGLIPSLPKNFKSYDDYSKSMRFQSLTKKKKSMIRKLAEKEKYDG
ncbi:hypothetical protein RclHR1_01000024 [Rhizophagus clarus]|uniref:Uncharacterized protein n=1 Tax=Rhizophagus clarus TaxID=94130 RepID=A0A2Z6QR15_9GLOM|nr:hypothetical protein RclHR1_01000024 [Rhizophagus clarus]GES94066.1 hypothetical protein GLOIN_2v1762403 [Rhizophagus clarus]